MRRVVMKKVLAVLGLVIALTALNARIESSHECQCNRDCWCKRPGLRHFRWLLPGGHNTR